MFDDFVSATLGLFILSKEKAEEVFDMLVEKGELKRDDAQKVLNRMSEKGKDEKERFMDHLQQLKDKMEASWKQKFVSRDELDRVERKIDELAALIKEKLE